MKGHAVRSERDLEDYVNVTDIDQLRRDLRATPDSANAWLDYARRLVGVSNGRAAYEAVKNAVDLDPHSVAAVRLLGEIEAVVRPETPTFAVRANELLNAGSADDSILEASLDLCSVASTDTLRRLEARARARGLVRTYRFLIELRTNGSSPVPATSGALSSWRRRRQVLIPWLRAHIISGMYGTAVSGLPDGMLDRSLHGLIRAAMRTQPTGSEEEALLRLAQAYIEANPGDRWAVDRCKVLRNRVLAARMIAERRALTAEGFKLTREPTKFRNQGHQRVLYALHESSPLTRNGYTIRTEYLIEALHACGWSVTAVTRPGYGKASSSASPPGAGNHKYFRLAGGSSQGVREYIEDYAAQLVEVANDCGVTIIQAASNFRNGLAAAEAARRLKIPSIYEMRGLWHLSRAVREPDWEYGEEYRFVERMELQAAHAATRVVVLSKEMADWLILSGIEPAKIDVVGNGVDIARFTPTVQPSPLREEMGVAPNAVLFGYAGAIVDYEGLRDLLEATRILKTWNLDARLLVLGERGQGGSDLRSLATSLHLDEKVHFIGAVPTERVPEYYAACDIAVVPRRRHMLTEIVPPLKVLEPLAMGLPLIASELDPIVDAVGGYGNARLFRPGNPMELARAMREVALDPDTQRALREAGRTWVVNHRNWEKVGEEMTKVYRLVQESAVK